MEQISAGCYQILFELKENLSITIGSLGHFVLPQGQYIFSGKANRGLQQLLQRHYLKRKKIRWHIDYLSVSESFVISDIFIYPDLFDSCYLHNITIKETNGHELVPRFGSVSEDGCYSHLLYIPHDPRMEILKLKHAFRQVEWVER